MADKEQIRRLSELARNGERHAQRELIAQLDQHVRGVAQPIDWEAIDGVLKMFRSILGRPVTRSSDTMVQRCRACRTEVLTPVLEEELLADDWMGQLGHRIRFDYDVHQCEPVEVVMEGCSNDELGLLEQSTEADAVRTFERADRIRAELRRRAEGGSR